MCGVYTSRYVIYFYTYQWLDIHDTNQTNLSFLSCGLPILQCLSRRRVPILLLKIPHCPKDPIGSVVVAGGCGKTHTTMQNLQLLQKFLRLHENSSCSASFQRKRLSEPHAPASPLHCQIGHACQRGSRPQHRGQ